MKTHNIKLSENLKYGLETDEALYHQGKQITQKALAEIIAKELMENPSARDRIIKAYYASKERNDDWWAFKHHIHELMMNNRTKTHFSKFPKIELVAGFVKQQIESENIPLPTGRFQGSFSG